MRYSGKEKNILAITLAIGGLTLSFSGLIMSFQTKPIINTKYKLDITEKKIAEAQAKTNEIKLKDFEIEINNPISVDIKDYLENVEQIDTETIKNLKLDTSLVNINQAGTYQYTIIYKKKKFIGMITVKEKELPNVKFTLKTLKLNTNEALSSNPRDFVVEEIPDEVYNNLTLDISSVDTTQQGDYTYYISYKGETYQGKIEIRDPGPTIITPATCPTDQEYDANKKACVKKETES